MSKASPSPCRTGSVSTASTEASQSARQKMQASVTGRIGASAKVQAPVARLLGSRCGDDAQSRATLIDTCARGKPARHGDVVGIPPDPFPSPAGAVESRSEEHTSELQSLMRISYAVFCLKKTKKY